MSTCRACDTANPPGARFCAECGTALARACSSCGVELAPGAKFCNECGTPTGVTPVSPPGSEATAPPAAGVTERRVCTVLFADLVGFTPLSESRDPEEVRELLSRYFDTARTVIARYGGVVEKFIGDAVMAVWGTPVTAEGDAERAVRAALDLVSAVAAFGAEVGADGLALRAGLVTGEVAASLSAVGEGMVAGDAVNTAARVQAAATPGTVWTDSATQRLAAAAIGFHDAGQHRLKGKADPVELWQATRVLGSVGGVQRVDGLEAPMIGRSAEERTVRELFHATAERRAPRLLTVTGAAGTGKSRLGWEFEKYIDGLADVAWWHRGRCLSYGEGVAYWALAEAVRQRFGIAAEDAAEQATSKLVGGLAPWLPVAEEREFVGIRLGRLLGLPYPGDTRAPIGVEDLFAGWRLLFERMAEQAPVVLVIEDAQYADEALLNFLEHLIDWARQSAIYVVLLARTELIERRAGLAAGRNRSSLALDPLDEHSMRAVLEALVPGMPEPATTAIVAQAQGNPLFAVETVRTLIDRDVIIPVEGHYRLVGEIGELSVPDSLHGLLAARLDTLDPALRALVADAAVLGGSFPAEALVAVSGRSAADVLTALSELVRRDLLTVSSDPLSPERGEYVFTQTMLRQVAYDTLSRHDRRARHLAVAAHLQRVFSAGGDEVSEVIAQHYLDALAAAPGADDETVRGEALASLIRAGERSERSGAPRRAAANFVRAAELVAGTDELEAAALHERAATVFFVAGDYEAGAQAAETSGGTYRRAGQSRAAARTLVALARCRSRQGRLTEAAEILDGALATLRDSPDLDTVSALAAAAGAAAFGDDPGSSIALADEAIVLGQALDVPTAMLADLFDTLATCHAFAGRYEQGRAEYQHAMLLADRAGDPILQGRARLNLSAALLSSDFEQAEVTAREALAYFLRSGSFSMADITAANLAIAQVCLGHWDEALAELARLEEDGITGSYARAGSAPLLALRGDFAAATVAAQLEDFRTSEVVQELDTCRAVDGFLAACQGDPAAALAAVGPLFDESSQPDLTAEFVFLSWPLAVRCAFDLDDVDAARRLVAFADARPVGSVAVLLRAELVLAHARLAAHDGDDTAAGLFDQAVDKLRAVGSPYHLAHALLDHAQHRADHGEDASTLIDEANRLNAQLRAVDLTRRLDRLHAQPSLAG